MERFSPYFTLKELTNSSGHPEMVAQNRLDAKQYILAGKRLSKLLESIRHILGDNPLKVTSGFRNEQLNKAVGSKSKNSKHTVFEAVDIIPQGISIQDAFEALIEAREQGLLPDLRKVLQEGSWLHVECAQFVGDYRGFFVSKDGNKTWEQVA